MTDNIEKEGIRRAIDRFQKEHPCHLTFDVTLFNHDTDFGVIQRAIDMVAKKCQDDADIHIICEMAKLYLEGVRPMVKPKQEWIPCSERLPEKNGVYLVTGENGHVFEYDYSDFTTHNEKWSFMGINVIAWMPLPDPYREEASK